MAIKDITLKSIADIKTEDDLQKLLSKEVQEDLKAAKQEGADGTLARLKTKEGLVDQKEFEKLEKKYNDLSIENNTLKEKTYDLETKPKAFEHFTKHNIVESARDEVYKSMKDGKIDLADEKAIASHLNELKKSKSFYFESGEFNTSGKVEKTPQSKTLTEEKQKIADKFII